MGNAQSVDQRIIFILTISFRSLREDRQRLQAIFNYFVQDITFKKELNLPKISIDFERLTNVRPKTQFLYSLIIFMIKYYYLKRL